MTQNLIAVALLVVAALYVTRRVVRGIFPKKPCGCSGCGCGKKSTAMAQPISLVKK